MSIAELVPAFALNPEARRFRFGEFARYAQPQPRLTAAKKCRPGVQSVSGKNFCNYEKAIFKNHS